MDFILIAFFCYKLYKKAGSLGLNSWRWALMGLWVMVLAVFTGSMIFFSIAGIDPYILKEILEKNQAVPEGALYTVGLMLLFMMGCAFLGYLIVKNLMVKNLRNKAE